jgi:mono/diheme cytochrome c family protein
MIVPFHAEIRNRPSQHRFSSRMNLCRVTRWFRLAVPVAGAALIAAAPQSDRSDAERAAEQFFERKIRPVVVQHCQPCHGPEKSEGGLRLDSAMSLAAGGHSGPAVVASKPDESALFRAASGNIDAARVAGHERLPDAVLGDLKAWIHAGAVWPSPSERPGAIGIRKSTDGVTEEDRQYWAFRPIRRDAPATHRADQPSGAIDILVREALAEHRLTPNPAATRRELIRRAFFDLIGLPPTPQEVEAFERDESPQAFERVIDQLLARPEYGERWARHWLDVVRYAQTNGYERDAEKPFAWRYRDYVIRAFNEDKPYDRFVLEQLAGDELDPVTDDGIIATGFYRLGVWDDEPDDAQTAEFEALDDVMVTSGAAFLGLTIGCARCHAHKFDPIPHEDYYKLLAFIRNIRPYALPKMSHDSATLVPVGDRAAAAQRLELVKEMTSSLEESLAKAEDAKEKKRLQDEIAKIGRETASDLEWALAVRDGENKPTLLLIRGNAASPAAEVQPAFLTVLGGAAPTLEAPPNAGSSGRRLALARWLVQPDHPLTARVMANRVWQHHFGRGIVKTTSDFGHSGMPPTHPRLLDWLAAELMSGGWSIKHLHKVIMLSQTYQMSSHAAPPAEDGATGGSREGDVPRDRRLAQDVDPSNEYFWRQNVRRLEAEAIRDSILFASGQLNSSRGGRGFFPHTAGEVLAAGSRPGDGWSTSTREERARRSIYAFVKRSMVPPFFEGFDYTNTATPLGERPVTTVAPQALMLLNDKFMSEQAAALARRAEREAGSDSTVQIERVFAVTLGRKPAPQEIRVASGYLERQTQMHADLATRLTFAADVPGSLQRAYMNGLKPEEFLLGPRDGWQYFRGRWGGDYEGITSLDRSCTPFALWQGAMSGDGVISARVTLQRAVESASILFRATAEGDSVRGYEVTFDPREQSVVLRRDDKECVVLGRANCVIPAAELIPVRIEAAGSRIRVWIQGAATPDAGKGEAVLDISDESPILEPGRVGIRTWGAAVSVDDLTIEGGGAKTTVPGSPETPAMRALESLCLLIFNLNEFIHID